MNLEYRNKLHKKSNEIFNTIAPLISGDVHLTNLPYHNNLGDALIWRGTEDFLEKTGHKILSRSSFLSFEFPKIKENDVIVLNGGGSFGDIWRVIMDFFIEVVKRYPNNRIILLSQSAWYDNPSLISSDATAFASHKDLHLIARDEFTYNLFKTHLSANNLYLAPDMAFAINTDRLIKYQNNTSKGETLYLRRTDKEWDSESAISNIVDKTSDWPTISDPYFIEKCYFAILNRSMWTIGHSVWKDKIYWSWVNNSAKHMVLGRFLDRGCNFILPFSRIVTTRLHVMILGTLLGKNIEYIDNTTGKLSAYANTWLTEFENVKRYKAATDISASNV